jgi:hypothetical protein
MGGPERRQDQERLAGRQGRKGKEEGAGRIEKSG